MNKIEIFDAFVVIGSFIILFCTLVGISAFLIIKYLSVAIGEIPLGVLIGLISSVWGSLKLLNMALSMFKEIRSNK